MGEVVPMARERRPRAAAAGDGGGALELVDRLAMLLAELVDQPLVVLPGGTGAPTELRLTHFNPALAERAATLLEEAGW